MGRPKKEDETKKDIKNNEEVKDEVVETVEAPADVIVEETTEDTTVPVETAKEVLENTDLSFNTEELTKELAEENEKLMEPINEIAEISESIAKSEVIEKLNDGKEVTQEELLGEIKNVEEKKEKVEKIIRKTHKSNAEFTSWWNGTSIEPF